MLPSLCVKSHTNVDATCGDCFPPHSFALLPASSRAVLCLSLHRVPADSVLYMLLGAVSEMHLLVARLP